ncbi:MAG TPA: hypothetical protein VN851_20300 [Thermoanaerobaculia bacterium]|nr:hypothetical protein [Thermoanaerobaculia bacterium]
MSAITPRIRLANLLLIVWAGLLWGGAAPLTAQPIDFGNPVRTLSTWIDDFGGWFQPAEKPTPPESGTCIDPNGKPKPCDFAPPGAPGA